MSRAAHEPRARLSLCAPPLLRPLAHDPFTLGVAAGEPREQGALLWTRLAPRPDEAGGGMGPSHAVLRWEVAADEGFRRVLARGKSVAVPEHAHSAHARVAGLAPAGVYWFRFDWAGFASPVGLFRTLPSRRCHVESIQLAVPGAGSVGDAERVDLALVARDDLELVILDCPSEGEPAGVAEPDEVDACRALDAWRLRYARALRAPARQRLRQRLMALDHWRFAACTAHGRLSARAQAFLEHAPVSPSALLRGAHITWGSLLTLQLGPSARAIREKNVAWLLRVGPEQLELASLRGARLLSDEGPCQGVAHVAARRYGFGDASYLRCELTRDWARWERVHGAPGTF